MKTSLGYSKLNPTSAFSNVTGVRSITESCKYAGMFSEGDRVLSTAWIIINDNPLRIFLNGDEWGHVYYEAECECKKTVRWLRAYQITTNKISEGCSKCRHTRFNGNGVGDKVTVAEKSKPKLKPTPDQRREFQMAELMGLDWNPDMAGDDARGHGTEVWELKSTGTWKVFAMGRDITPKKIDECETRLWGFAFFTDTRTDVIEKLYCVHPDGLKDRWAFLRAKFAKNQFYIDVIWENAKENMERKGNPDSFIEHIEFEGEKIFTRGGLTLANQSIPKGDVFKAIEMGLGIEIDMDGDIPAQVKQFELDHPLKGKKKR